MIYYWTVRKIRGPFDPTQPGDIKVLSSEVYHTITEIEEKYKGWKVINMDTGIKRGGEKNGTEKT